jgi:hypothetical protein
MYGAASGGRNFVSFRASAVLAFFTLAPSGGWVLFSNALSFIIVASISPRVNVEFFGVVFFISLQYLLASAYD